MPRRKLWFAVLSAVLAFCLAPAAASAATITVSNSQDDIGTGDGGGDCTLREAISASNIDSPVDTCTAGDGGGTDTIEFGAGVTAPILLDETGAAEDNNLRGDLDIHSGTGALIIAGGTANVTLTIDGTTPAERVIDRNTGSGIVTLQEVTLTGGTGDGAGGGGIINRPAGSVTLDDATVTGNSTVAGGGGIANGGGAVLVDDSTVSNNTSSGTGAGINNSGGQVSIQNGSVISGNQMTSASNDGGGISVVSGGSLFMSDSTVTNNDSARHGGGIYFAATGTFSITDSVISANDADGDVNQGGGGISIEINNPTSATIDDSQITGNEAGVSSLTSVPGGGIENRSATGLAITDTLVQGNTSTGSGAGIRLVNTGGLNLQRSVVTGNQITPSNANVRGGGIDRGGTSGFAVSDSLISGNTVTAGAGSADAEGGGIYLGAFAGVVTLERTTVSGNTATGGDTQQGGGLNLSTEDVNLYNMTVSGNSVVGSDADGGGLSMIGTGPTRNLSHSTFAGNSADDQGDGISADSSAIAMKATIVDDGCSNPQTDASFNVVDGTSCGAPMDQGDPMLNALRDNGGALIGSPTDLRVLPVHDIDPASPAVDIDTSGCAAVGGPNLTVDERQLPRPFDGDGVLGAQCDAGAYELNEVCAGVGVTQADATGGDDFLPGDQGGLVDRRDVINGLGGDDNISGFDLDDVLCGGAQFDTFTGGTGNDRIDGGADPDLMSFATGPITANLSTGQATGEGTDTLSTLENLTGSAQGDTLTGDGAGNNIAGFNGDDVLAGGNGAGPDGNDTLTGGPNTAAGDTVTYSTRTDAIGVDLGTSTGGDLVGPEADTVGGVENATGGSAGDNLMGDGVSNVLTGLGGNDTLNGLGLADTLVLGAGANTVTANDSTADTINCTGGGPNTGTVDTAPPENYVNCSFDGDAVVDFFDACPTQAGTLSNGCPAPAVAPPPATTTPAPTTPAPKKCKKGQKLKKGKCVKKKRKK